MCNDLKLPVTKFEWIEDTSKFNKDFIKNYNEDSDEEYFLEVDVQYLAKVHEFHNDLRLSPEKMKIEKVKNVVANLHNKTQYILHIRNLEQALNHRLVLKKVHRAINFNQNACLKSYIDMNADLRKKAKTGFENNFFKLMNDAVFGKAIENVRTHKDNNLVTTERRSRRNTICNKNKKAEILLNKPVYLGVSILELRISILYN